MCVLRWTAGSWGSVAGVAPCWTLVDGQPVALVLHLQAVTATLARPASLLGATTALLFRR